jgi:predicted RNA-binding protein (virulence factor B family)
MIETGKMNNLKITRVNKSGVVLDGGEFGEIFLSEKEAPGRCKVNDSLEVFVYMDSKSKMVATTRKPHAQAGQLALLNVVSSNSYGAFMDWGLKPDLRVSVREQKKKMKQGQFYLVYVYNDKDNRIAASSKLEKFLKKNPVKFVEGQSVDLVIGDITPMGYKAIINNTYLGVLYRNEVFRILEQGQKVRGFIKKIREDGKIDLSLGKSAAMETDLLSKKILKALKEQDGSLDISDKTPPKKIYDLFGVSKKRFKNAIGALYKKHLIMIEDHGIRIAPKQVKKPSKKKTKGSRRYIRKKQ